MGEASFSSARTHAGDDDEWLCQSFVAQRVQVAQKQSMDKCSPLNGYLNEISKNKNVYKVNETSNSDSIRVYM